MEIKKPEYLACVHDKGKIIKMFTDTEEALAFADKIEKKTQVKMMGKIVIEGRHLSCDPLYNVIFANEKKGYLKGVRDVSEKLR